ncbi:MAG TPA: hypothetical protein VE127_15000, partial [Solirubrobacteraceae bacterium]|nr:hypothetical protein [Solirubrobacteraceae bacterium]
SLIWGMRNAITAAIEEARNWEYPWPYEPSWGNLVVDGVVLPAVWGGCVGSVLVLAVALIAHAVAG